MKTWLGNTFSILVLTGMLWLSASSAWAVMSVATLNGTYHGVNKNSSFVQFPDGNVRDNISGDKFTLTFNGNGVCSVSLNYQEFEVNLSSPYTVDSRPPEIIESIPCTYTVSPAGEGTIFLGEESNTFWVSYDGNVLTSSGAEVYQDEDLWHDSSILIAVKTGSGMNNGSLIGTYKAVSYDTIFFNDGGKIVDTLYANNVTLTFNGNGNGTYSYSNGANYDVNLSSPDAVSIGPDSGSGSFTYTVTPMGETQIYFPDGSSTLWLSADGNVLLQGRIEASDGQYDSTLLVCVKIGSGKTMASLNSTFHLTKQDKSFEKNGLTLVDAIISDDPDDGSTVTFDGSGQCELSHTDLSFIVDLSSPDEVFLNYEPTTESCTYTVTTNGQVLMSFADGSMKTRWLSANNNILLGGGPYASVVDELYLTKMLVAVNSGTTLPKCAQPESITVPASDPDGNYEVNWGPSATDGATYVLEEALDSDFSVGLQKVYRGTDTSVNLTGRSMGTYYYRVKATKMDHRSSTYLAGASECAVGLNPLNDDTEFVKQVYRDFLNREADPDGLAYWVGQLESGAKTRPELVEGYLLSPEFQGNIAPVVRLYSAYFLRIPDYDGLMYWVNRKTQGTALEEISDAFATSPEFQTTYGSLTNAQFVQLVYQNVLGREPDADGLAFWTGELDSGNRNRGQVMAGFSESAEYKALMNSDVYVTMVYIGLLRRSPDADGFDYWVNRMDGGDSGQILIDGFLKSAEYAARFE